MMLKWFNAREASDVGVALADQFAPPASARQPPIRTTKAGQTGRRPSAIQELLHRADRDVRTLQLNFFQKARFANSFKWRLIENGIERKVADEVTQSLIVHLSQGPATVPAGRAAAPGGGPDPSKTAALLARAKKAFAEGAYAQAVELYDEFVSLVPDQSDALNALGVALYNLGRYQEAEQRCREAIDTDPENANALYNLAGLLQASPLEAEPCLRRVLKINPKYPQARAMLGTMLASSGRHREAKIALRKALKLSPERRRRRVGSRADCGL